MMGELQYIAGLFPFCSHWASLGVWWMCFPMEMCMSQLLAWGGHSTLTAWSHHLGRTPLLTLTQVC